MPWYKTGTVTVTTGSPTVTGSGTDWISNAAIGEGFMGPDGKIYEILAIVSAVSITLASNYLGATSSGAAYTIVPTQSYLRDLASQCAELISAFSGSSSNVLAGRFGDGASATPGISFASDQDTGFYRIGANSFAAVTGGVVRTVWDSVGNLGIGTNLPLSGGSSSRWLTLNSDSGSAYSGGIVYGVNGVAKGYTYYDNIFSANTMVIQGVLGVSIGLRANGSNTNHVTVDVGGNVGIGTNSPDSSPGYTIVTVNGPSGSYTTYKAGGATAGRIGVEATYLSIEAPGSRSMRLSTNGLERVRVDENGNTGFGVTAPQKRQEVSGYTRYSDPSTSAFRGIDFGIPASPISYGGMCMHLDSGEVRIEAGRTAWGGYQTFYTNGLERARIDTTGNLLAGISGGSMGNWSFGGVGISPNGAQSFIGVGHINGTVHATRFIGFGYNGAEIGSFSQSGTTGVSFNSTSDHRLKINPRPADAKRFMDIQFRDFEWVDGRHDCGVIAHELQQVYPDLVLGEKDAIEIRQVEITPAIPAVLDDDGNEVAPAVPAATEAREFPVYQQVNYMGLIGRMGTVIQQLERRIAALEQAE